MPQGVFVLDASVALSWAFRDEFGPYSRAVLEALAEAEAFVPSIWPLEVGNGLLVAERRRRLTRADVSQFVTLIQQLPIIIESVALEQGLTQVLSLAREQSLSTYDASYLDLAMRLGMPLATLDKNLKRAAKQCEVKLLFD